MATITIRNLDDALKQKLRQRAAKHSRSMEEEAREILRASLTRRRTAPKNLATSICGRFSSVGGVELELPERDPPREPPGFED